MTENNSKQCTRCRVIKPYKAFANAKETKDGRRYWCRECCAEYRRSPQGKIAQRKAEQQWRHKRIANGIPYRDVKSKRCSRCGEVKAIELFSLNKWSCDRHQGYCKMCEAEYQRSPAGRAATRKHYMSEHGKARVARDKLRHPKQFKAGNAIKKAVANGELPRPDSLSCADCAAPALDYHHESYERSHWLDVVPLCRKCHKARHRTIAEAPAYRVNVR